MYVWRFEMPTLTKWRLGFYSVKLLEEILFIPALFLTFFSLSDYVNCSSGSAGQITAAFNTRVCAVATNFQVKKKKKILFLFHPKNFGRKKNLNQVCKPVPWKCRRTRTDVDDYMCVYLPCLAVLENRDKPKHGITSLFIYRVKKRKRKKERRRKKRSWRLVITTCSDRL